MQFPTRAIHSTLLKEADIRPVSTPIYLSTNYHRNTDGTYNQNYIYSRADNPNRRIVERSIAELEGGKVAYAFGSGMAAIHAVFQSLKAGDHVLLPDDVYFNVLLLVREVLGRWNLSFDQVNMADPASVQAAFKANTKLIWLETPSNPQLKLTDIAAVAQLAKAQGALVVVDNTWPTPVLMKPIELGADVVIHSTTKYFGGHSDVMGGCVVLKEEDEVAERIRNIQLFAGGIPSPFDCWLVARGVQSVHLRVMAQTRSAQQLAEFLELHPAIERVLYPGLPSHPQHSLAKEQMPNGYGAMLSVLVKGNGDTADAITTRLQHFTYATSLGGVESLVERRKAVEGDHSTTPENLLRLSIGLEAVEDLIADWELALQK